MKGGVGIRADVTSMANRDDDKSSDFAVNSTLQIDGAEMRPVPGSSI